MAKNIPGRIQKMVPMTIKTDVINEITIRLPKYLELNHSKNELNV